MEAILTREAALLSAKEIRDLDKVILTVSIYPETLTWIPDNRGWSIFHQAVYSCNVNFLRRLLATQQNNPTFSFFTRSKDNKTATDIVNGFESNENTQPMKDLVALYNTLEKMLNHASAREWEECRKILQKDPRFINRKPPHRRYNVIHYLALANDVEEFKKFLQIENINFDLSVRINQQKINMFARENNAQNFATYLEETYPEEFAFNQVNDLNYAATAAVENHHQCIAKTIMDIKEDPETSFTFPQRHLDRNAIREYVARQESSSRFTRQERQVIETPQFLAAIKCPITGMILKDPVLASDGFTYEREAIQMWLKNSKTSPMTGEDLPSDALFDNNSIRLLVTALQK